MLVLKELVAWWVKHHSLRLHVLFNRKNNNNNPLGRPHPPNTAVHHTPSTDRSFRLGCFSLSQSVRNARYSVRLNKIIWFEIIFIHPLPLNGSAFFSWFLPIPQHPAALPPDPLSICPVKNSVQSLSSPSTSIISCVDSHTFSNYLTISDYYIRWVLIFYGGRRRQCCQEIK